MDQVGNISLAHLEKSRFLKPFRMHYDQNGVKKTWDLGMSHPSVAVVIFNKTNQSLVMVKQLRPAVLFAELMNDAGVESFDDLSQVNECIQKITDPDIGKKGITLELCAGIVDKTGKSLAEIAKEEVEEECGFRPAKPLEFVQTFRASIGTGGANMTLFYAEVSEEERVSSGGGVAHEGEMIEVVEMSLSQVSELMKSPTVNCPTFTLYGLSWFLANKKN